MSNPIETVILWPKEIATALSALILAIRPVPDLPEYRDDPSRTKP